MPSAEQALFSSQKLRSGKDINNFIGTEYRKIQQRRPSQPRKVGFYSHKTRSSLPLNSSQLIEKLSEGILTGITIAYLKGDIYKLLVVPEKNQGFAIGAFSTKFLKQICGKLPIFYTHSKTVNLRI